MDIVAKLVKFMFIAGAVTAAATYFFIDALPSSTQIVDQLSQEPRQTAAAGSIDPMELDGYKAEFEAVYEYDVSGLVVEEYTADNWLDYAHQNDPFNSRDLCLIWGSNTAGDLHKEVEYGHGEFTCSYRTRSNEVYSRFRPNRFSNNHLIPADHNVEQKLSKIRIGDQVRLVGYLVNMEVELPDGNTWTRSTSVNRDDMGQGACELIYLTDVEVMATGNFWLRQICLISVALSALSLLALIVLFVYDTVSAYHGHIK